jgi:hypothetical protein
MALKGVKPESDMPNRDKLTQSLDNLFKTKCPEYYGWEHKHK